MTEPGREVVARSPQAELVSQVRSEEFLGQLALALPENVSPRRFGRAVITALQMNPDLATQANRDTLFQAILRCAQDGLMPDGREAAIAIYKGKAQYLPMIGGFRKIAGDHGWAIRTEVVYEHDEFEFELGLDPKLRHVPARPGVDRGQRVACYAVGEHRGGMRLLEVMYGADVAKRQKKAQTQNVWSEWPDRMWEKTVGKALFKKLPIGDLDPRVARVIAAADAEPEEARQLMYGSGRALPPPEPDGDPAEGHEVAASTETGAAEPRGNDEAEAAPVEEEPGPMTDDEAAAATEELKAEPDETTAEQRAIAAGKVILTFGKFEGEPLEQAVAKSGVRWLKFMLDPTQERRAEDHPEHLIFLAAEAYAAFHHPELLA